MSQGDIIEVHQRIASANACTRCANMAGFSINIRPDPHDHCTCTRDSFYAKVYLAAETEVPMLPPSQQDIIIGMNVPKSCFTHEIITSVKGETGWEIGLEVGGISGGISGGENGTVTKGVSTTYCYSGKCDGATEATYAIYDVTTILVEKLYIAEAIFDFSSPRVTWLEKEYRDEMTLATLDVRCV